MGYEHWYFFRIEGVDDCIQAGGRTIDILADRFIRMHSAEIFLSGHYASRIERSLDGERVKPPRPPTADLYPNERKLDGWNLTTVERPEECVSWERDRSVILARLEEAHEKALALTRGPDQRETWTWMYFWGSTRVFLGDDASSIEEVWAVREQFGEGNPPVEIAGVSLHLEPTGEDTISFDVTLQTIVYSYFTGKFDASRDDWGEKKDVTAADRSADLFVDTIVAILKAFPNAHYDWETGWEGRPDPRGSLPDKLEAAIGSEKKKHAVGDLPVR